MLVVGGGMAGLAAALELAQANWQVTLLEARLRLGGRIWTVQSGDLPLELGAEFIHGNHDLLWKKVHAARLEPAKVPDRNQLVVAGALKPLDLWGEVARIMQRIDPHAPDQSFADFLTVQNLPEPTRRLGLGFVEGFDAAEPHQISAHALHASEHSQETSEASQYRLTEGYSALIDSMVRELVALPVHVHDWRKDLFARGAYSYIPVNGLKLPKILATPLADTLCFAGEATASHDEPGTVHGALASGVRAAKELLAAMPSGL